MPFRIFRLGEYLKNRVRLNFPSSGVACGDRVGRERLASAVAASEAPADCGLIRPILRFLVATAFIGAGCLFAESRPNVVIVMTDDQGYGDLGVHGNETIETPVLDAFARESLWMERFYVNPLCAPTRASLMTGRYHLRTGVLHTSRGAAKMFGDEITIAELLRDHGYKTGIFGKWHLGDNYPMRPQDQGFDETLIHKSGGIGQTPDTDANYFEPVLWKNGSRLKADGYCTDLFFDAALDFIESSRGDPYFLYIAPNVPHTPLEVAERYSAPFEAKGLDAKTAKIYGMLKNLDENFERLLNTINRLQQREKTMVVFMSDNGPTSGRYNAGLRGAKGSVYEGGIRVPFYVRWPGQIEGGANRDLIAAHVDLLPTILEAANCPIPESLVLDGKSLLPVWRDQSAVSRWPDRVLFTQHIKSIVQAPYQNATAFTQRYKLVAYPKAANDSHFSADTDGGDFALYDLKSDPKETTNVASAKPEVFARLKQAYDDWFRAMKASRDFQPGVIHLGTKFESPTHLCRYQDGHRDFGTDPESVGWPVRVEEGGRYSIAKTEPTFLGAVMAVSWQGEVTRKRLASNQDTIEVNLVSGEGMLDVWIEDLDGNPAPKEFDVLIERL